MNIETSFTAPVPAPTGPIYPIVIVGHVDHGKSTLIGRLMHDTGSVPPAKLKELKDQAARRGRDVEWSFLLDALEVERDQGITLDTTRIWFNTKNRAYVIIDAPGHHELVRNMLTGAATAEAAVLVIDASHGMGEQTRRHATLLSLLGMQHIIVVINKIDLIGHDQALYQKLADEIADYLARLELKADFIIPVSARHGDNITAPSPALPWFQGLTLIDALDHLPQGSDRRNEPLRFPIQDIWFRDDKRILVGRIAAGSIKLGDTIAFTPSARPARVTEFLDWGPGAKRQLAYAGESIAITLDEPVLVERGYIGFSPDTGPDQGRVIDLRVIWLDQTALKLGDRVTIRTGTQEGEAIVEAIHDIIDLNTLEAVDADTLAANAIGRISLHTRKPLAGDNYLVRPATGRAILARGSRVLAGAFITAIRDIGAGNLTAIDSRVSRGRRSSQNGHAGGVLWLTGLPGSGKSTLALGLENYLVDRGWQASILDGDNLRQGLNRDLDFSAAARTENIRRTAEVARLMADAGMIVIVSLISPFAADRVMARRIIGDGFHEVFVAADIAICQDRDPKGLYARARRGEIKNFTGVDAPYEAPTTAELVIDTGAGPPAISLAQLTAYALHAFSLDQASKSGDRSSLLARIQGEGI
jgi:bifunctional enzyme CysN/CysC